MMDNPIGEYVCPKCGPKLIEDCSAITVYYPKGYNFPVGKIVCPECAHELISYLAWTDALTFDYGGAEIVGFSFSRGPQLTNDEIVSSMEHFDEELEAFLAASRAPS